ncbi:MAG: aldehyde dehydrogenase [Solirubrobacteraceae bacterium]|jgi:betaine-aldehyde dehydrogenase|nr:aldehyde dehydrogenase [Solirubrobacteraceae bacterium]
MTVTQESAVLIGGRWEPSLDGHTVPVISPATEEPIAHVTLGGVRDIERAILAARKAFDEGPWPRMSPHERAQVLARASVLLMERHDELAETITREVGTPIKQTMRSRVTNVRDMFDVHVAMAETYPWVEIRDGMRSQVEIRQEPVGVVGAIVPWNVPFSLTSAKLAPALLTGCTVVLKPAEETPLNAFALAEILTEAGLPHGVLSVIPADRTVSEALVSHPAVDKISFTGSTGAGKKIAAVCGAQLKRYSLELGGKSAAIILEDADLEQTLARLLPATINNNGQVCVNQTRIVAPQARYDEIVEAFTEGYRALAIGDPMDPGTDVGPLIHGAHRERVEGYIRSGREDGARITIGGGRPEGLDRGFYLEPTIFADVDNGMKIAQEEIFGPVLAIIPYRDEDEAVRIANDSPFGLSGSVWGPDTEHAATIARRVRTGNIGVNLFTLDFAAPFGGFKESGVGREYGPEGIAAFTELQSVHRDKPVPAAAAPEDAA